jgi:protein gp37
VGETSIEWSDFSVNPFRARLPGAGSKGGYSSGVGHYCEKVSRGCKNCYSSTTQSRFGLPQFQEQRNGVVESFFDASKLTEVLRRKAPTKWFWCDMTDMFGDWVPFEWIAACFGVMAATPQHTHQVLTKRPVRALEFFAWLKAETLGYWHGVHGRLWEDLEKAAPAVGTQEAWDAMYRAAHGSEPATKLGDVGAGFRWPLPNVHLGVSVEDQKRADERIPLLLQCPAAVRWVSAEPLLEAVNLTNIRGPRSVVRDALRVDDNGRNGFVPAERHLDWVVVGGESGRDPRPFDVDWARSVVEQCRAAGVPLFVKQLGANPYESTMEDGCLAVTLRDRKGGDPSEWPADLRVRMFPGDTWPAGSTP